VIHVIVLEAIQISEKWPYSSHKDCFNYKKYLSKNRWTTFGIQEKCLPGHLSTGTK